IAGVVLDRLDRKQVMIASDLVRFVVALGFIFTAPDGSPHRLSLLFALSGMLMFASPFFTSGRAAILPTIASREELHAANSLTQTTGWLTLTIGTFARGTSVAAAGYKTAFVLNAPSFLLSAISMAPIRVSQG